MGLRGLLLLSTITLYHWSTYLFSKCKHPATRSMRGQPVAKNSRRRHRLYVVLPRQGCGMSVRETALNYIPESFPSLSLDVQVFGHMYYISNLLHPQTDKPNKFSCDGAAGGPVRHGSLRFISNSQQQREAEDHQRIECM